VTKMLIVKDIGIEVFPCTQRLLDEAASMADLPIVITSYHRGVPACFRIACRGKGYHEIHVDASWAGLVGVEEANFYLAHEATHAIRAFSVPFDQRRGTTLREAAKDSEVALLALAAESVARGKYTEIQEVFKAFVDWENAMLGALGGPEEIEVDRYVLQQCPELKNAFGIQLRKSKALVEIGLNCIPIYWEPLDSMLFAASYSVLRVEGEWIGQNLIKPFYGFPNILKTGKELLAIVEAKEPDHLGDINAEEQWIEVLGLQDIFKVVSIDNIADFEESPSDEELVIVG
jgi:hypothetical protein